MATYTKVWKVKFILISSFNTGSDR